MPSPVTGQNRLQMPSSVSVSPSSSLLSMPPYVSPRDPAYLHRRHSSASSFFSSVSSPALTSTFDPLFIPVSPLSCFLQLTSEDSYQIATMGVQGLRVEIVSDAPPPPDEPPYVICSSCSPS
jgi:hypothetical protein